jgi:hypothetical protein
MSGKQDLNSVQRFRKQSEQLVLEEYSHCEVPAGCGGVVLRWRNPHELQWALFWMYTQVRSPVSTLLDGEPIRRGRVDLTIGRHLLTVALENADLSACLLLFAAAMESKQNTSLVRENPVRVLSANDGSWKYVLDKPAAEWNTLAFDDASWHALTTNTTAPTVADGFHGDTYSRQECVARGAICLGLPLPEEVDHVSWWQRLLGRTVNQHESVLGNVWIRKVFEVVGPTEPQETKR